MSVMLGNKKDKEPVCCSVCSRQAGSIGYAPSSNSRISWVCDDDFCVKTIGFVYNMGSKDLNRYEQFAINEARKEIVQEILDFAISALYDAGIKNLDTLDAETFSQVCQDNKQENSALTITLEKFLLTYAATIKIQLSANAPPF